MSEKYKAGDLVIIKALPGISTATLFDGKTGVIARAPLSDDGEYEVYVDDRTLWLSSVELVLMASHDVPREEPGWDGGC